MIVRTAAAFATAAWIGACAAAAPADKPRGEPAKGGPLALPKAVALKNAGFESAARADGSCAEHWSCTMHADPGAYRFGVDVSQPAEGKQAFCVERVTNEPWALVTQGLQDPKLRGTRLRFTASVRVERTDGGGAGPWALVHGPQGNLAHVQKLVQGTQGWQRLAIDFPVGQTAQILEVGMTLEGGGRACIDDARLEILPPA